MNALALFSHERTFRSLRMHRNYRLYFFGNVISLTGNWLQNGAQTWLILQLTHSAAAVGILSVALYGPYALVGLFTGALSDQLDHRKTLLLTQTALMLCSGLLAGLTLLHHIDVWEVYVLAGARSLIYALNNPSRQAFIVQMVGREELPNAIALNESVANIARILGPGVGGVLIAAVGSGLCFALNAASYIGVILALLLMHSHELYSLQREQALTLLRGLREGLSYTWRTPSTLLAFVMLFVIMTISVNFNLLLPVLVAQTFHGGPEIYGFLVACLGIGSVAGAIVSASIGRTMWRVLLASAGGLGLLQILLAPLQNVGACAVLLAMAGLCFTIYTSTSNALVQLAAPKHLQGRVAGFYSYIVTGVGPLGDAISGWLSQEGGTPLAFLVSGGISILMASIGGIHLYLGGHVSGILNIEKNTLKKEDENRASD
jgi:MFS family permease